MSFKTSVLIWFSRFRGIASPPAPLLQRGGRLTGWGFCVRQKNMGFRDIVTYKHRDSNIGFRQKDIKTYFSMTWVLKPE